jgi:hypothetical protein
MKVGHGLIVNEKPELAHITALLKEWTLIVCVKNEGGRLQRDIRPIQRYGSMRWCIKDTGSFNRYIKNSKTFQYIFIRNFRNIERVMWSRLAKHDRIGLSSLQNSDLRYNNGSFFSKLFGVIKDTRIVCYDERNASVDTLKEFKKITNLPIFEIDLRIRQLAEDRKLINLLLPDESYRKTQKDDSITILENNLVGVSHVGRDLVITFDKTDAYINQFAISNVLTSTGEITDVPGKTIWYRLKNHDAYINVDYRVTVNKELVENTTTRNTQKQKIFKKLNINLINSNE